MARLSTCKNCNAKITADERRRISNKTYCIPCYEEIKSEKEISQSEYSELISTICDTFKINAPTGLILKQIKQLKDECKYTYGGMLYTLWYITNVLNRNLDLKYGVALIKYHYENAEKYYTQQVEIKKSVDSIKLDDLPVRKIKLNNNTKTSKERFLIDIDRIVGDSNEL